METISAQLKQLITLRAIDAVAIEGLTEDVRYVKDEIELHKRERRRLHAIAARLSSETLKLAAAKALAAIAPTPARFATVLLGSFLGGLAGVLLLNWALAIRFGSLALLP